MTDIQPNNSTAALEIKKQGEREIDTWAVKTYLLATGIGAVSGLLAAFLLVNNRNKTGIQPTVSPREGFKIAVLLVGAIRSVANLWE
jgi:hypothetical protein